MASLKNALNPTCPNHDSPASHTVSENHCPVKYANPKSGESMMYIQSLIARINNIQQSAINMIPKNRVTMSANQNFRTIPIRLWTQLLAD